ncbi:MAG: exodeoxyribonuclease V subunit alpha [Bacteroidota bacterium]
MKTINDVHQQFAAYFGGENLEPYAWLLSQKLAEGNICLPLDDLTAEDSLQVIERYPAGLAGTAALANETLVDTTAAGTQPFVLYNNKLYLQRYFRYETLLLDRIYQFLKAESSDYEPRKTWLLNNDVLVKDLFNKGSASSDAILPVHPDWQLAAAVGAFLNHFTIITGGPGTGKTTTVAKILSLLFNCDPGLKVALAAPTGKAAARMAESLKSAKLPVDETVAAKFGQLVPATIHRLLKTEFGSNRFKHNRENPLNADVVIVDESSMIDVALFARLLDAIGPTTRLILLGDKDQLASVEEGSLFGDLCEAQPELNGFTKERAGLVNHFISGDELKLTGIANPIATTHPLFEHVIELRQSHRFKDTEGIGKFSKAIIQNNTALIESFFDEGAGKQVHIDPAQSGNVFNSFIDGYEAYILESGIAEALQKFNQLRVLCAIREGEQGLYAINKKIEDTLQRRGLIRRTGEFYEHRPIMITSNNYELGLFNGDIGIIRKNEQGILMAWFEDSEGKIKAVLPGYIAQAETVYAMTIHKSQGSEFTRVLIVLPEKGAVNLLTRELLYTGITRAREQLVIQGSKATVLRAAAEQVRRTSGIIDRFQRH